MLGFNKWECGNFGHLTGSRCSQGNRNRRAQGSKQKLARNAHKQTLILRIPKVPDTNQSQLEEKLEKTKIKRRCMQSLENDRSSYYSCSGSN